MRRAILEHVEKEHQPQVLLVFTQRAEGGLTLEHSEPQPMRVRYTPGDNQPTNGLTQAESKLEPEVHAQYTPEAPVQKTLKLSGNMITVDMDPDRLV